MDERVISKKMVFIIVNIFKENKKAIYKSLNLDAIGEIEMDLTLAYLESFAISD